MDKLISLNPQPARTPEQRRVEELIGKVVGLELWAGTIELPQLSVIWARELTDELAKLIYALQALRQRVKAKPDAT